MFDKTVILLDMDGVLANFHQGTFDLFDVRMSDYHAQRPYSYAIHEWITACRGKGQEVNENVLWDRINRASQDSEYEFWYNLAPYPWYETLYDLCREFTYKLVISTSPGMHHLAFSQKVRWMERWLPQHSPAAMMLGSKKWLMAKPNHILIDDSPDNCKEFVQHGGRAILFPQDWNGNYPITSYNGRLAYVRETLNRITAELKNKN